MFIHRDETNTKQRALADTEHGRNHTCGMCRLAISRRLACIITRRVIAAALPDVHLAVALTAALLIVVRV